MINPRPALIAILVLCAAPCGAQTFGAKGGLTLSHWASDAAHGPYDDMSYWGGGGFIRFGIAPHVWIEPELMVTYRGSKVTTPFDFTTPAQASFGQSFIRVVPAKTQVKYVEVPLLLRLSPMRTDSAAPYLLIGPALAHEIGCEVHTQDDTAARYCTDGLDDISRHRSDVGATAAVGYEFGLSAGILLLEARYTYGLRDLSGNNQPAVRNRSLMLMGGFAYVPGKWPF